MKLPKPKSTTLEVLYHLLAIGETSIENFYWMAGFRTRISELTNKHDILLTKVPRKGISKFKNPYTYHVHTIRDESREKAIKLYLELCNSKK